jgi:hypothetical protein
MEIEQSPQKETWIPDTESGILQVMRRTSNLNSRCVCSEKQVDIF